MRAHARWLREVAGRYRTDASRLRGRSAEVHFSGPAAKAFRHQTASQADRLQRAASALFDAADVLQRAAVQVEQTRRSQAGRY